MKIEKRHSEESKKKRSEAMIGEKNPFYGKTHSSESRKKMSEVKKGRTPWNKGKKGLQVAWNKGKSPSKESIEKQKKTMKDKYYSDPDYRKKISETNKKKWTDPDYRKRQSESHKKYFSNPEARERQSKILKGLKGSKLLNSTRFKKGHKVSEEIRQKLREHTLKMYASGNFPKQTNTKPERQVKAELIKRGYKEKVDFIHQYNFNNKFLCDFCFPSQKLIIEIQGDFWHANPEKYPEGSKLHPHQIKGKNRDKSKKAYITKVDNCSWTYKEIWENDINKDVSKCIDKINLMHKQSL